MRVRLSTEEVSYLMRVKFLPKHLLELLRSAREVNRSALLLELTDAQADEFRDAFGDRMQLVGFDVDYKPTAEGEVLESLVDRFLNSP